MSGAVDAAGKPTVFTQHLVQQSLMKRLGSLPPNGVDFISMDGCATLPYDIANIKIEYTEQDPGIPFGFWRSVGASFQGFAVEAFIDELATTAGKDPYEFRRDLLGKAPRHLAALNLAAEKAGWGSRRQAARGHRCDGSLRQHPRPGHRGVGGREGRRQGPPRRLLGGYRLGDQPRYHRSADGRRDHLRLTAALKGEDHDPERRVTQRHFNDYQMFPASRDAASIHIVPSTADPAASASRARRWRPARS
jgi:isoquinoline 1-oxidoreductase beta subunit